MNRFTKKDLAYFKDITEKNINIKIDVLDKESCLVEIYDIFTAKAYINNDFHIIHVIYTYPKASDFEIAKEKYNRFSNIIEYIDYYKEKISFIKNKI